MTASPGLGPPDVAAGTQPAQVPRELAVLALLGATTASLLAWLGPVGTDFAAHAYGRLLFLRHGFLFWDNYWYAGRYTLATYSLLYYPLAAILGIRALAVATVACAVLGFALVVHRQWGSRSRWSTRAFALTWSGVVLIAVFPFALGAALALLALAAIQSGHRARFALLGALALASSPLAFLLLLIALGAAAIGSNVALRRLRGPIAVVAASVGVEALLWLLFPGGGRFPFGLTDLLGALAFAILGVALTVRVPNARPLPWFFALYGGMCLLSYLVPTELGSNVTRLRFAALPCALLVLALRRWRPLPVAVAVVALALAWNVDPFLRELLTAGNGADARASYWRPAITFLHRNAGRSYRVEAVDTAMHTPALYLASAGIPLARGWFRQDDFPVNAVLYRTDLDRSSYMRWLRELGVEYVVLSAAPPDYSSRAEAALLGSGRSGLARVFHDNHLTIFRVPHPLAIVVGASDAKVVSLTDNQIALSLKHPGWYRIAVRYSPYWRPSTGCIQEARNGMMKLHASRPGRLVLAFDISGAGLLQALTDSTETCAPVPPPHGR